MTREPTRDQLEGCTPDELEAERERRWFAALDEARRARGERQFGPMARRYTSQLMEACRTRSSPADGARKRYEVWCAWGGALGIGSPPASVAEPPLEAGIYPRL